MEGKSNMMRSSINYKGVVVMGRKKKKKEWRRHVVWGLMEE
jgi:hypothetical protein